MKNILSIILIGMVAIGLSSCATNKPLALNSININKSMQVEPLDELIKQFSKTNNSLIPKSQFNKELSPSNIAELAVILNPKLKIDRYDLNLAEVNLEQSKLLPNPQINFSISKPISGTLTNPYIGYGISPSFDVGSIIQRNTKVKIAQLEFESKKLQLKWDEWQTYEYAKLITLNFIILSNKLDLYKEIEHLNQEKYNRIYKAYKEGLISQSEMLNTQSQLQQSELEVQANEKLLNNSKSAIYQLLGLPYNYTLPINTRLKFKPLQNFKEEAQLLNNVKSRLDLIALKLAYESNEEKLRLLSFSAFMPISVSFPFVRDTSNVHTIGFGVSISFPIFNQNQGQIKYAQISGKKIYDEYINRIKDAQTDINKAMSNVKNINQTYAVIDRYFKELQSKEAVYKEIFKSGSIGLLPYYDYKINLINQRLILLKLQQNLYDNLIALEVSSGENLNIID